MADCQCLIVSNNFPPKVGGAGAVYAGLARAANGRVRVLCASVDYRTGAELPGWREHDAACEFPVERIAQVRPPLRGVSRFGELLTRARLLRRVLSVWRAHRFPALLIADDASVGWLMRPVQSLLGCRVVLYTHGDDLAVRAGEERLRARRTRQFMRADAIVAVSAAAAEDLARGFSVPRDRITVIPNGIDPDVFRPTAPDPALLAQYNLAGRRVISTVARLVPRKGVAEVLAAVALLRPEFPDLHYLIVGDGPERAALQARASEPDLAGHVTFAGEVPGPDVPRYLALAEIMIMPNRRMPDGEDEGFGLVFLEANACGKPVIAGRAGGAVEVVQDGVNGLLVDGADTADIATTLRRLLNDAPLARQLAANGLALAQQSTWAARTASFMRLCAEPRS